MEVNRFTIKMEVGTKSLPLRIEVKKPRNNNETKEAKRDPATLTSSAKPEKRMIPS
jgi:hypothetical protein